MRAGIRAAVWLMLMATPVAFVGCKSAPSAPAATAAVAGEVKTFPIHGRVVSVDTTKGSVLLDHEAVPGFMEAMTMSYPLKDKTVVSELHPGDRIAATLIVHKTSLGYEDPQLDQIVVTAQAKPDYKPAVQYHEPAVGDALPDFKLINQSGRTIRLEQFKGRALLITFIYTRCPMADYCPKMSRNFAEIDKALAADPKLYGTTHLLSVSFDPEHDTPAALKSYGGAYTGKFTNEKFAHWEFAVPPKDELDAVLQWFGVGVTPGENKTLNHSLSTVLVGRDGKVAAWYPANDWSPDEVVKAIKGLALATS